MKMFKEIYYRLKLWTWIFNWSYSKKADNLIKKIIQEPEKINGIKYAKFEIIVEFKDGNILLLWNENKYYAWLFRAELASAPFGKIVYNNARPSAETMYKFKQFLIEWDFRNKELESKE